MLLTVPPDVEQVLHHHGLMIAFDQMQKLSQYISKFTASAYTGSAQKVSM